MSYDAWKTTVPEDRAPITRRHDDPTPEIQTPSLGWCHPCVYCDEPMLTPATTTRATGRWYHATPMCHECARQHDDQAERQGLARLEG
jgi:hypothetical protein